VSGNYLVHPFYSLVSIGSIVD